METTHQRQPNSITQGLSHLLKINVTDTGVETLLKGTLFEVITDVQRAVVQIALSYDRTRRDIFLSVLAKSIADPELLDIIRDGSDMEAVYIGQM